MPNSELAWFSLGISYLNVGLHLEAIDAYQKTLEIKQEYFGAWHNLGNTYLKMGQYSQAIDALQKSIEI